MYPLKQALADARAAEAYAKDKLGRDAFAVNVVKRSGETMMAGSKWRLEAGNESEALKLVANGILARFADSILDNKLSPKFIVDIEEIIDVLVSLPSEAVLLEIEHLFNQHNKGFETAQMKNETAEEYRERIQREKKKFFDETIYQLIEHCDKLGNTNAKQADRFKQKCSNNGKPADWINLRNAVKLMDIAYYIGKGGGR
jgi:CRISPR/Cas system-associated protein Cas10 (large subunit of type III CRISPR-Cas system)